jgi:holo-[acyl-carrier protein] synthase
VVPTASAARPEDRLVIGVGLDAVGVERFRAVLLRRPGLAGRVFSERERARLAGRADPVPGLAARFAAKEAAMKALGVGLGSFDLSEIEVLSDLSGAPRLAASGRAAELARARGVTGWLVSLTHTDSLASAIVLAEGSPAAAAEGGAIVAPAGAPAVGDAAAGATAVGDAAAGGRRRATPGAGGPS